MRALAPAFLIPLFVPFAAIAQPACPEGTVGCSRAPIAFAYREALPGKFDLDTGWVPDGSPVQVRFHTAFVGHTNLTARGELQGSWPEPMQLEALGTPGGGTLESDYGVQLLAHVRLHLDTGPQTFDWEGRIPYIPQIDFRATARQTFDPWGFAGVHAHAVTARQRIADVALTDSIIRIPGISGGLNFDAQAVLDTDWQASQISFGLDADPITAAHLRTLGVFRGGPWVEFQPVLEGALAYSVELHVFPSLYVSLLGRRWMLMLADIPLRFGPFSHDIRTEPSLARLDLPDIGAETTTLDFGSVTLGESSEQTLYVTNSGPLDGRVLSGEDASPFALDVRPSTLTPRSRIGVPVSFRPVTRGPIERTVVLITNDPDTPRLRIRVLGSGVAPAVIADAAVEDVSEDVTADGGAPVSAVNDGGCNCRTPALGARGDETLYLTVVFGLLLSARRRGRRAA